MGGNRPVVASGKRTGVVPSEARSRKATYSRARCEYCRGWVANGDHREILVGEVTKYVHRRHPRHDGEQQPRED